MRTTSKLPRLLAIFWGKGNSERARIILPFQQLRKCGWVADWAPHELVDQVPNLGNYDIYILPRLVPRPGLMDELKPLMRQGAKFVYDIDDDLTTIHPDSECAAELRSDTEGIARHLDAIEKCSAVTVSTKYLGDKLKKLNSNITVLKNCINPDDWSNVNKKEHKPLTIGWLGSPSHRSDLLLLVEPWKIIADKYPGVRFMLGGYAIPELVSALGDRLSLLPRVQIDNYPKLVENIDIGTAPLVDSEFNKSKSSIKFLEYSMLGIPCVASPVEPYRCINHTITGFLARDTKDWVRFIGQLIRDPFLRRKMGEDARKWTLANHNIQKEVALWETTYLNIYNRR
jgi:glycosyltransferase involved in cell wall biosynthesis